MIAVSGAPGCRAHDEVFVMGLASAMVVSL
jgi:hypothetical protein